MITPAISENANTFAGRLAWSRLLSAIFTMGGLLNITGGLLNSLLNITGGLLNITAC